jgi:SAM-dependent methyltransferase
MALHEHPVAHRLCSEVLAEVQEVISGAIGALALPGAPRPMLLDVGCWEGDGTTLYSNQISAMPHGIEVFPGPAATARARGIEVAELDLETSPFPWPSGHFDVVVANQVFEHLKNIWLPLSEVYRVLKPGGHFIISVPNLASLHNRVLLALGRQPTSIRTLGIHVRGYTLGELVEVVTLEGAFSARRVLGAGFYPLPARLARPLARAWPGASHTSVLVARKTDDRAVSPWQAFRQQEIDLGVQTFYG